MYLKTQAYTTFSSKESAKDTQKLNFEGKLIEEIHRQFRQKFSPRPIFSKSISKHMHIQPFPAKIHKNYIWKANLSKNSIDEFDRNLVLDQFSRTLAHNIGIYNLFSAKMFKNLSLKGNWIEEMHQRFRSTYHPRPIVSESISKHRHIRRFPANILKNLFLKKKIEEVDRRFRQKYSPRLIFSKSTSKHRHIQHFSAKTLKNVILRKN